MKLIASLYPVNGHRTDLGKFWIGGLAVFNNPNERNGMKSLMLIALILILPINSLAFGGDHIEPVQPYEYTEAKTQADQQALKCAQLTAALILNTEVVTSSVKNDRGLAEVACRKASDILGEIRKKLNEQPYDPNGLTVNPNP